MAQHRYPTSDNEDFDGELPRRGFMTRLSAFLVGAIVTTIPTAIAAVFAANPIFRRPTSEKTEGLADFVVLSISPEAVPGDGSPISATVVADRTDAWNHFSAQQIGTIWLRRDEKSNLIAFSTICPHLGCRVEFRESETNHFYCPCHNSQFTLSGEPTNRIPPRPMDRLETKVVEGRIWVRYQEFRGGLTEQIRV